MTPQEQQMLKDLTDRISQTQLSEKDPEAEKFIFTALGRNTDSLYIMAQTILVQQYALDNAKKQLDDAKGQVNDLSQQLDQSRQQVAQPQKHTSFLGSLLGTDEPRDQPPPPQQQQYGQPQYAPVANYAPPPPPYVQPPYGQAQYQQGYGAPPSQGGGFLRSAMTTATGVAAGALAFEGIESLMHGFEHQGGYGGGQGFGGGGYGGGRPEEIINNNYYGDSDSIGSRAEHSGGISPDIEDRRDGNQSDFSASSDSSDDMSGGGGDYGSDDSGGGNDDSGGGGGDYGTDDNS